MGRLLHIDNLFVDKTYFLAPSFYPKFIKIEKTCFSKNQTLGNYFTLRPALLLLSKRNMWEYSEYSVFALENYYFVNKRLNKIQSVIAKSSWWLWRGTKYIEVWAGLGVSFIQNCL